MELSPEYVATTDQLYEWLNACHLVERVEWQTSSIIKVFPTRQRAGSATQPFLEFEVAHHDHTHVGPYTVCVVFKDAPEHLVPHAWRILRHVCRGKELFPNYADEQMNGVLQNYADPEQEDDQG